MFSLKLIILFFSLQVFGLFAFQFRDSGTKHLQEKILLKTAHLNLSSVQENWIQQPLDHFNAINDPRTWQMRYFSNMDLYRPGGPIILFIGGESQASPQFIQMGAAFELARQTGGALISSEHRYYGASQPLPISRIEDYKYLSSVQAMGDLVYLIKYFRNAINAPNAKVVVIGGSYSGNLAVWMRMKYPEIVHAAYASSAPVLAKKNFFEYNQKVADDFRKYGGESCYNKIQNTFNRYLQLLKTQEGIEQIKREVNICPNGDLTKIENQQMFILQMIGYFEGIAQYQAPNGIINLCSNSITQSIKTQKCINVNLNEIKSSSWLYQVCTEFGYLQTSVPPFTNFVNVDFYVKMCMLAFGPEFNERRMDEGIARTNAMFGGRNPKVTRVVFTNGDADPWSTLGVLQSLSAEAPALVIPDEHHCSDIAPDSPQSANAQSFALSKIIQWLQM